METVISDKTVTKSKSYSMTIDITPYVEEGIELVANEIEEDLNLAVGDGKSYVNIGAVVEEIMSLINDVIEHDAEAFNDVIWEQMNIERCKSIDAVLLRKETVD